MVAINIPARTTIQIKNEATGRILNIESNQATTGTTTQMISITVDRTTNGKEVYAVTNVLAATTTTDVTVDTTDQTANQETPQSRESSRARAKYRTQSTDQATHQGTRPKKRNRRESLMTELLSNIFESEELTESPKSLETNSGSGLIGLDPSQILINGQVTDGLSDPPALSIDLEKSWKKNFTAQTEDNTVEQPIKLSGQENIENEIPMNESREHGSVNPPSAIPEETTMISIAEQ